MGAAAAEGSEVVRLGAGEDDAGQRGILRRVDCPDAGADQRGDGRVVHQAAEDFFLKRHRPLTLRWKAVIIAARKAFSNSARASASTLLDARCQNG